MTEEPRGIRIPRDVAEPSSELQKTLDRLSRDIEEQTVDTQEQIKAMTDALAEQFLPGLRQALQHLDPLALRSAAMVADTLARSNNRDQFMVRFVERARTDPDFPQEAARAEAVMLKDSDAGAKVQRLTMDLEEGSPELRAKIKGLLPDGVTLRQFFSALTLGVGVIVMAPDGFSSMEQLQTALQSAEVVAESIPPAQGKKSGKEPKNIEE